MAATRGIIQLEAAGVPFAVHRYRYVPAEAALQAAAALGVEPGRMLKSLVVEAGDRFAFCLVPAGAELLLPAAARALGERSARMAARDRAERVTGYRIGGISPLGSKRSLPVLLDAGAARHTRVCLNGGGRGVIVELATADLVALVSATVTPITRPRGP